MSTAAEGAGQTPQGWCPRCLARFPLAVERCPSCGLSQVGSQVDRLRQVVSRLGDVEREQWKLAAEATELRDEKARLLSTVGAAESPVPTRVPAAKPSEWRAETVRDVLLILGSILLALAALTFSVIAWRRFGDSGRAGILLLATLAAALGTVGTRTRLPATAEALSAITVALFLVDWYALRRAGVASGISGPAWWPLGTATAAGGCAAVSQWLRAPAIAGAGLSQLSGWLVIMEALDSGTGRGIAIALLAAAAALAASLLSSRPKWLPVTLVFTTGAVVAEVAALGFAFDSGSIDDWGDAAGAALVLVAMAIAPALARLTLELVRSRHAGGVESVPPLWPDGLVALAAACLLAAGATLLSVRWQDDGLVAAVAVLGAAAAGATLLLPRAVQRGTAVAAAAAVGIGVLGLLDPVVEALTRPLSWLSEPWTGDLGAASAADLTPDGWEFDAGWAPVVALVAAVAALLAAVSLIPRRVAVVAAGVAAAGALAVLPLAAGWPIGAAEAVTAITGVAALAAAVLSDRRHEHLVANGFLAIAGGMFATALGWGLATEAGTLTLMALLAVSAGAAGATSRHPMRTVGLASFAAAAVVAEAAAITRSMGGAVEHTGFVVLVTGGAILVASVFLRGNRLFAREAVENLARVAMAVGVVLAAVDGWWLAASLTVSLAVFALAAVRDRHYAWVAAGASVTATWAWLAEADVGLLEAYTLPAAAVALACGLVVRRTQPNRQSWMTLGPGLAVGMAPTLGLAVSERVAARPLLLSVAALAAVMVGARFRLQAPLIIGAVVLVILAIDTLAPVAAQLPRWLVIGSAGALLLWLGATAERRLIQLRTLSRRFQDMENPLPQ